MKKLRKFLNVSVMVMTVIAMCGFASIASVNTAKAAASAGDLIKMEGNSSVYYFDGEKRFVFPNETTYNSWYSDFSGVVTIESSELQSYPLGGNVTMRPGTKLVKITTDPSVYAVEHDGVLRKIQNEAQAAALYGTDWAQRVVDVPDAFFVNYTIGEELANGEVPAGSLVKTDDSAAVYYFDGSEYREIETEEAMNANRFEFSNVITIETIGTEGDAITGMEEALVDTAQGSTTGTGTVVTGSGLMVSLNSATPAAMNIPEDTSVEFVKINLTAANDGPVNVNSITLTAFGLSNSDDFTEVIIEDNGVKLGSDSSVNDREATINFSNPIYVAAGTTKTLTVKATVTAASGSYGLGIASASDITSTGATVSGSFPIQGNLMSPVTGDFIGTIDIVGQDVTDTVTFGEDEVLLADFTMEAEEEDALVQSLRLYNDGDRNDEIISNPVLYIDGDMVAEGAYEDRYITFNFDYEIEESDMIYVEVRGDINVTDIDDEIKMIFDEKTDINSVGMTHGFSMKITGEDTLSGTISLETGEFIVDMDNEATPDQEVKPDTNNVVLATILFASNGENAVINSIDGDYFYITETNGTTTSVLEDVKLVDLSNGATYDLTVTDGSSQYNLDLDEEIYLNKGVTKTFELRADITDEAVEASEFEVTMDNSSPYALDIEGEVSGETITDIDSSIVDSSVTTVESASLDVTPVTLTALSVVGGAEDKLVYQANLEAGSADDVELQTIRIASSSGTAFVEGNIVELVIKLDGVEMESEDSITAGSVTFNSLDNNIVEAGETSVLTVEATFSSDVEVENSFALEMTSLTARSAEGNDLISADITDKASRVVTVNGVGTLSVDMLVDDADANNDSLVLAGSESDSDEYLGEIKFTTTNEDVMVEDLTLTASGTAESADIESVKLYNEDGTLIAEQIVESDGDVIFEEIDLTFDADQSTSLFIAVNARGINVDGDNYSTASAGTTISYSIDADSDVVAKGVSSKEDITATTSDTESKVATIVGTKLNAFTNALTSSNDLEIGSNDNTIIAKYALAFENGENQDTSNDEVVANLNTFALDISTTSATATNIRIYDQDKPEITATFDGSSWADLGTIDLTGDVILVVKADIEVASGVTNASVDTTLSTSDVSYSDLGGPYTLSDYYTSFISFGSEDETITSKVKYED